MAAHWHLLGVALLALAGLWYLHCRALRRLADRLRRRHEQRLSERERAARGLHDVLLQGFQGVVLRIQAAAEGLPAGHPSRVLIEDALGCADEVLEEGRQQALGLATQPSERPDGLARVLEDAGAALSREYGVPFRLRTLGRPRLLLPAVYDEVREIVAEACLNAFRHARARTVSVELRYGVFAFSAVVRDDGIGCDARTLAQGRPGHFGLAGMRERAACIRARLKLSSQPGRGTVVSLRLRPSRAFDRA